MPTRRNWAQYWRGTLAGLALTLATPALAQDARMIPMAAPAEPDAIRLGTGGVAGSTAPEAWFRQYNVAMTRNVSSATLTPFLPAPARATGAAVIVAPGGGFLMLSMENEGWRVARALADRGIAAFVLKYRLKPTPAGMPQFEHAVAAMFASAGRADSRLRPEEAAAGLADPIADATAVAAPALANSPEQLWRIDQLTDGTYRITPKGATGGKQDLALIAIGASTLPSPPSTLRATPAGGRSRHRKAENRYALRLRHLESRATSGHDVEHGALRGRTGHSSLVPRALKRAC